MATRVRPAHTQSREIQREKGQFWTPNWVAEAMVAYVLADGGRRVFDPAVGAGAFFRAGKKLGEEMGHAVRFEGTEVDSHVLREAIRRGLPESDLAGVEIRDFVLDPPTGPFASIVANPPYIRHHRLTRDAKDRFKRLALELMGRTLDGRAGLHVYFLLRALQLLDVNGRLAFIVPADICEGVFASQLWTWITRHFCLDAVITFTAEASPFPDVDTNPLVVLIRRAKPRPHFLWARCRKPGTADLKQWIMSGFVADDDWAIEVLSRDLHEGLATGLSRIPRSRVDSEYTLGSFATVVRGIATGANDFFFLTKTQASLFRIPDEFLLPAIGRTRDIPGDVLDHFCLEKLEAQGRPTLLFCPDGRPLKDFPAPVREYVEMGESKGIPLRPLISQRRPWYKMEVRQPPPMLFAYLGRRNARFIRNVAGVVPLTCLLCVYPKSGDKAFADDLWSVLQDPRTLANLPLVGKSYGSGAIKVEPRALERLPIPPDLVHAGKGTLQFLNSQCDLLSDEVKSARRMS